MVHICSESYQEWKSAIPKSFSGKLCSQSRIVSWSFPRQGLPLRLKPGHGASRHFCPTVDVACFLTNWWPHWLHCSMNMLPCNSAIWVRGNPERKCKPSMFWLTTYCTFPAYKYKYYVPSCYMLQYESNLFSVITIITCMTYL